MRHCIGYNCSDININKYIVDTCVHTYMRACVCVQSTTHQTIHFGLCSALKGITANIELLGYSETCC
jgi:hypothetical protein